jgi:hypothetical protein
MKINKNGLVGASVFLISFLMILSSSVTIATYIEKNPIQTTAEVDTANMEYPVNFQYEKEVFDIGGFQRVKCYASNLHNDPNDNLAWFYSDIPDDFIHIAEISSVNFLGGGCFAGEFGDDIWWACEYSDVEDSNIWQIDEETGAMYLLGNCGVGLNGLAYDPSSDTLYGCGSTELFIINQDTADATLVGEFGTGGLMIGIACDSIGNLYGEDLGTDSLYDIDTSTGVATLIGAVGIDLNYAQDIGYDKDHDILYSTGYKGSSNGGGHLGTLDLSDGHFTEIGAFPIGVNGVPSEVACLAIPYGIPNQPPEAPEIDGPNEGTGGEELTWTFHSDDPNGDELKYFIDWGDETTDETDCYPSCTPVNVTHTYPKGQGKYTIKAYAQECPDGEESDTTEFEVSIPRTRSVDNNQLILRFLERFPNTFIILRALFGI